MPPYCATCQLIVPTVHYWYQILSNCVICQLVVPNANYKCTFNIYFESSPKFRTASHKSSLESKRSSLESSLLRMSLGSGGGRSVRLWRCCLLSVPLGEQASRRRWDCSGLGHVARRCFGTKWYGEVPGARSTRDGDTGSFARFF